MSVSTLLEDVESRLPPRLQTLVSIWDQVFFIVVFVSLIWIARGYEGTPREFPLVFLVAGLIFLLVEFIAHFLPDVYKDYYDRLMEGVASEMEEGLVSDATEESELDEDAFAPDEEDDSSNVPLLLLGSFTMIVFVGLAYLIGFLYAIPIYIALHFALLGSDDWWIAVITILLVVVFVYVFFGMVINVPIEEGLIEW